MEVSITKRPNVSVLLSVYNTAPWLPACLDSILAQTMTDFEIICVNDGSTDSSPDILAEYARKDPRIRIITQENQGLSGARNTAAHHASGEWLYFMDSDDLLKPEALDKLCSYGKMHDLQIVYMNTEVFADSPEWEDRARNDYEAYYKPHSSYPSVYTGKELYCRFQETDDFIAPVWTFLIRHSYYQKEGLSFYPQIAREDDLLHRMALLNAERVGKIDSALILYRIRSNSIMTNPRNLSFISGDLAVCNELRKCLKENHSNGRLYWALYRDLCNFMNHTLEDYQLLPEEEQKKIHSLPEELRLFGEIIQTDPSLFADVLQLMKDRDRVIQENERLQVTFSYRLGRRLTAIPRKLRDTFKHKQ